MNKDNNEYIYLARQPIFNKDLEIYGYELLYRNNSINKCFSRDYDLNSSSLIINFITYMNKNKLLNKKKAFINITKNLVVDELIDFFNKDRVVFEILEHIKPEKSFIKKCLKLKKRGFKFALDNYVPNSKQKQFLEFVDIVKVDCLKLKSLIQLNKIKKRYPNKTYLAEKVENHNSFKIAKNSDYSLFQGFFFKRPEMLSRKKLSDNKAIYLKMLDLINKVNFDYDEIGKIIKSDASLVFKLLKFINSAYFALPNEISSIKQALTLLGINKIRKWASLIILSNLSESGNKGLLNLSLIRGFFCENIAAQLNKKDPGKYFLLGVLSLIDIILERKKEFILDNLKISNEIKNALLNKNNNLFEILDIVIQYENDNYSKLYKITDKYNIGINTITNLYFESIQDADQITSYEFL